MEEPAAAASAPATEPAGIDMDEIRPRIIPDATLGHVEGYAVHLAQRPPGNPDVDRHALHMERAGGDAVAVAREHGVGLGRSIPRNHLNGCSRMQSCAQRREQIEQLAVDRIDLTVAEIPEQDIDRMQCTGLVFAVDPVDRVEALPGVEILERQAPTVDQLRLGGPHRGRRGGCETKFQESTTTSPSPPPHAPLSQRIPNGAHHLYHPRPRFCNKSRRMRLFSPGPRKPDSELTIKR